MKKLRLVVTEQCNKKCSGCCMKDWNEKIEQFDGNYTNYTEIILTGGEPLLDYNATSGIVRIIKKATEAPVYLYTSINDTGRIMAILSIIDGITYTIHNSDDTQTFRLLVTLICFYPKLQEKSLRVNIFKNCNAEDLEIPKYWSVKSEIEWIKDCPLPAGEVIKRL